MNPGRETIPEDREELTDLGGTRVFDRLHESIMERELQLVISILGEEYTYASKYGGGDFEIEDVLCMLIESRR